ncbi:MAG: hypothetical protein GY714_03890 [Desulfobacterales bacterium]|nr:hypothetical protein [Desulfobacterales bacterium]
MSEVETCKNCKFRTGSKCKKRQPPETVWCKWWKQKIINNGDNKLEAFLLNIHQRLNKVMQEVSTVMTDTQVTQGNESYKGVSHDAVISIVRPHLVKHRVLVVPTITNKEQTGNRTTVEMDVSFINIDNPEDKVVMQTFGYGVDYQDKGPGKAISYAVKYAYLKVLGLETKEDPINDDIDFKKDKISDEQHLELINICKNKNFHKEKTLKQLADKIFDLKDIRDLTVDKFEQAKKELNQKVPYKPKPAQAPKKGK